MINPRARQSRRRSSRRQRVLICALAGCVLLGATAEAITRHRIDARIDAAARNRLTGPVSVGIGLTPALIDAATGQIPGITISAPSTTLCKLHDVDATATLTGVRHSNGMVATRGASASIVLTPATLTRQLDAKYPNATVTPTPAARAC